MKMKLLGCLVLFVSINSFDVLGSTRLVGIPSVKVVSSEEYVSRTKLSEEEQKKNKLIIEYKNGKYYWVSRKNRLLKKSRSGAFDIYSESSGNGFVKIMEPIMGMKKTLYMEITHSWLATVTYWGEIVE